MYPASTESEPTQSAADALRKSIYHTLRSRRIIYVGYAGYAVSDRLRLRRILRTYHRRAVKPAGIAPQSKSFSAEAALHDLRLCRRHIADRIDAYLGKPLCCCIAAKQQLRTRQPPYGIPVILPRYYRNAVRLIHIRAEFCKYLVERNSDAHRQPQLIPYLAPYLLRDLDRITRKRGNIKPAFIESERLDRIGITGIYAAQICGKTRIALEMRRDYNKRRAALLRLGIRHTGTYSGSLGNI